MDLRTDLRTRLTAALRGRDRPLAAALRSALAALENAEAVEAVEVTAGAGPATTSEHVAGARSGLGAAEAARRELTDDEERAILAREVAELREAATTYAAGAPDRAAEATRVADVLAEVLDEVLDEVPATRRSPRP